MKRQLKLYLICNTITNKALQLNPRLQWVILDTSDDRLKRLTANDIIGNFLKRRELVDL